jgi:hypothetical protein
MNPNEQFQDGMGGRGEGKRSGKEKERKEKRATGPKTVTFGIESIQ